MSEITNLIYDSRKEALVSIYTELVNEEVVRDSEDMFIGNIDDILVLDRETKEGQKFNILELQCRAADGKRFIKRWSVDFARKYLAQLGHKAEEIMGSVVVFKQKDKFRNIGFLGFVTKYIDAPDGEHESEYYNVFRYRDEESTASIEKLKKLGL